MIKISFNGEVREFAAEGKSYIELLSAVDPKLLSSYVAVKDGENVVDLRDVPADGACVELVGLESKDALTVLRHTTTHIMAEAVKHLFPDAKLAIGPATETGFFYDFECTPFTKENLDAIEKEMKKIIKQSPRIERKVVSREEAKELMAAKGERYKLELIDAIPEGERITLYSQDDFVDLCMGPHLLNTRLIKGFKLLSSSTTYWRGDKNNPSLSRIYGTAFFTKEECEAYLAHLEHIKNIDHNKIGREMELFTTVDVIGQGLPLLMPKGAKIIQTLQRWIEDLEDNEWGYVRTKTPLMAKSDLYKISGHWDHYKDGMFVLGNEEKDKEVFALRPMTCPFQYYVYKATHHSYRDLPLRYSETSTHFRNEDSGEMHGLTRVRQFTISEGHLIVRPDQMVEEFKKCLALAKHVMETLGLQNDVTYVLAKWNPENRAKYIGDAEVWEQTQEHIRQMLKELEIPFVEEVGGAAFYGPKVDINAKNVYGKEDTMITVQWDALLSEQFDMYYVDQNGEKVRPYIIHRTSMGCYERTLAWLIEKYEGKFPTWLAPEQVRILPISEKYGDYANEVAAELRKNGVLVHVDNRSEKIGYKIREARNNRVPYMLVLGQQEEADRTVAVRSRYAGDEGVKPIAEFVQAICEEIRTRTIRKVEVEENKG